MVSSHDLGIARIFFPSIATNQGVSSGGLKPGTRIEVSMRLMAKVPHGRWRTMSTPALKAAAFSRAAVFSCRRSERRSDGDVDGIAPPWPSTPVRSVDWARATIRLAIAALARSRFGEVGVMQAGAAQGTEQHANHRRS